jgi:peptidoglycan/xylan/chitin deacetylase (PgdA/CDA1 family)
MSAPRRAAARLAAGAPARAGTPAHRAVPLLLDTATEAPRGPVPAAAVAAATAWRPSPLWRRRAQRVAMKAGAIGYETHSLAPQLAARQALLGDDAPAEPRLLVRVDEFPHAEAFDRPRALGTRQFRVFDELMREAGVPYALAVVPRPSHHYLDPGARGDRPLDDGEARLLREMDPGRVELALHGRDHRTRFDSPRRRSELCGLEPAALEALLDRAEDELARRAGIRPRMIVPPFNRFDAEQYPALARRYAVVCGGPESVALLGFHPTPCVMGEAVYLPSYPPLYGGAEEVAAGARELARARAGVWAPVVLHWGDERDDGWRALRRALPVLARYARPWGPFVEAAAA